MVDSDLFGGFSVDDIAAIAAADAVHAEEVKQARALATQSRRQVRRAKNEATLAEILPAELPADMSWHVISHGDIDSLSYMRHVVKSQPLDFVLVSTWCMARPDVEEIAGWLDAGRVKKVDWYVGEIFPNQYGDEYELVQAIVAKHGGRVCVARNHSKVMLGHHEADAYYVAIESSANVNTNPRIEQSAIHRNEDLFHFYADFYAELVNIDRNHGPTSDASAMRSRLRRESAGDP